MSIGDSIRKAAVRLRRYACSAMAGACVLATAWNCGTSAIAQNHDELTQRAPLTQLDNGETRIQKRVRRLTEVQWTDGTNAPSFPNAQRNAPAGNAFERFQTKPVSNPQNTTPKTEPVSNKPYRVEAGNYWWQSLVKQQNRSTSQRLQVDLNSLLVGALANSARIKVLGEDPLITETEITTADAAFDWYSFLEARWDDLDEPVGSTLTTGGPSRFRDHNVNVSGGIRRRNLYGGEFEVSQRLGHQNSNSVFFVPNNQGTSRLTFSYTQPLLRGAGRVYNTSMTVLAKLNTDIATDDFHRQLQEHLLDVTQAYWNLYFERGKLLQQQKLLENGVEILDELESREALDALQSQIVRARAAVENRRAQLVRARLAIRIAEARLRALINDPALGDTTDTELIPAEDLSELPMRVSLRDAISEAMRNRPEISAAMTQIKAACVRMNLSKSETLPLLNVVLDSYLAGLEGNSRVFGALNDQFTEGVPSYGVGLQYERPIWNRAAQSRLQKRRLELRRMQHQFRQTMETLKLEVEVSVHELNAAYEALSAKRRALEAAQEEVFYLKDRWELLPTDNGSASLLLEDLLDAQDRLTNAEESLLQSTLEYSLAQVTYKKAIGSLLSHNNIQTARSCECNLPRQTAMQIAPPGVGSFDSMPATSVVMPREYATPQAVPSQEIQTEALQSAPATPADAGSDASDDAVSPSDGVPANEADELINRKSVGTGGRFINPMPFENSSGTPVNSQPVSGPATSTKTGQSQANDSRFDEPIPLAKKKPLGQARRDRYSSQFKQ